MRPANLRELRSQFQGSKFKQLVQHHLRRRSQEERIRGVLGTTLLLPETVRHLAEDFVDRWNPAAYEQGFWQKDAAVVFDEITHDARECLRPFGLADDDEAAFNLFNVVVLNYAYSAHAEKRMREFMGIRGGDFPWVSALALLYPISATIYIANATPAPLMMVAGYGVANLGYLLFGAGLWAGSFRVLGLKKRWQVIAGGAAAFVAGTALSTFSPG